MRKLTLVTAAMLAAFLVVAGVAGAINGTQGLDVTVKSTKAGTKDKPKSVGTLKVTTTTSPPGPGEAPFATKQAVIYFDKNVTFGGSKFKSCTTTSATSIDSACKSAKVGGGSAQGAALGVTQALVVTAYNAASGKKLYLHVRTRDAAAQPQFDTVINATLATASGDYGRKLVVPIPQNLQTPAPNVFATLTSFITSVGGTSKGSPYVGLKGCSGGKLKFKGTFSYTDGTSKTATDTVNCSK
jgi:hypothetical protein